MSVMFEALMAIVPYIISYFNLGIYKFKLIEYVYMTLSIVIGCYILSLINYNIRSLAIYSIPIIYIYWNSRSIIKSVILHIVICLIIIFNSNFIGMLTERFLYNDRGLYTYNYYIMLLIILVSLFCITKIIGKLYEKYQELLVEIYNSKYIYLIIITLIGTFFVYYFNVNWTDIHNEVYFTGINSLLLVIYFLSMIIIFIAIVFFIVKDIKFKFKQEQIKNLQEYTKNLEELYMDMRKFRHDYINILSSISSYISQKDMMGLEGYFYNYIYPLDKTMEDKDFKLGFLKNIAIMELKGLLSAKLIRAQELNLNVTIDITEKVSNVSMNIIDLVRVVGILLDNAIEATLKSEDKVVKVGVINKESSTIIVIINSYSGDIPPIHQMFKEGFSTKGDNRGIGLSNMKSIINNYRNIALDTSIEEKSFIQCLTINNKI